VFYLVLIKRRNISAHAGLERNVNVYGTVDVPERVW